MFDDIRSFLIVFLILVVVSPVLGGASCQRNTAMDVVRDAHTGLRGAMIRADEFIADGFDDAGDTCIVRTQATGLTGQAASDDSDVCMSTWLQLDTAIAAIREAMAELEEVYEDIDNGRESDWEVIALRVLTHARGVIRLLDELDIAGADEVIAAMREAIDQVCSFISCNGGE